MFRRILPRRVSVNRLLVWLVRGSAAALIGAIGFHQLVEGNGFALNTFPASYLSASLNVGRNEDGKFELSLAMQPLSNKPPQTAPRVEPADPSQNTSSKPQTSSPRPEEAQSSSGAKAIATPAIVDIKVAGKSDEEAMRTCSLPSQVRRATNDGQLMLVSFPATAGRIDGYGANEAAISPELTAKSGYNLPLLQWLQGQGALSGYRHTSANPPSHHPLSLPSTLASVTDGEAGDYVMSLAHGAVDFLAVGSGDYAADLNVWYHGLNAGFRTRIMANAPCQSVEPPDLNGSRSNIKQISISETRRGMLAADVSVSAPNAAIRDFNVNGRSPSTKIGTEVRLASPNSVAVAANLVVSLDEKAPDQSRRQSGWSVENARIGMTRLVNVEAVVNGKVAVTKAIAADGSQQSVQFDLPIKQSSWIALRIQGAAHTNPVFVLVDNMPIRASRGSVEWIMRSLLETYELSSPQWTPAEASSARAAYEYSFAVYQKILDETKAP